MALNIIRFLVLQPDFSPVRVYTTSTSTLMVSKIVGEQDLPQVTCVGHQTRCSDEGTTSTRSSCNAHNDPDYAGLLLGRQIIIISSETTIFYSSSGNGDGAVDDPKDLPLFSTSNAPPPSSSPSPSPSPSLPTSTSSPPYSPPPPLPSSSITPSHSHSNITSHSPSPSPSPPPSPPPSPSPSSSSSPSPTPSPSSFLFSPAPAPAQRKLSNLGPIVGGIAGGLLILVLLLLFYYRRRRLSKDMINPFQGHINQGAINSMVMLVGPSPTNKCATGSGRSRFSTPSPSFFAAGPLQHADSGVRIVNPLYVELPPAYTQV